MDIEMDLWRLVQQARYIEESLKAMERAPTESERTDLVQASRIIDGLLARKRIAA